MSRKTENIYSSLEKLKSLQERLSFINSKLDNRELEDIDFGLKQELKNLTFWIDSLYCFNGKSKSNAKKEASRENGKKGGRPPKRITELKRRRLIIEKDISELEHSLQLVDSNEEEGALAKQKEDLENELSRILEELEAWNNKKG